MAHRYKHTVDIVWLTEDLTIVTKWKTRFTDGKRVPAELATGEAGMAFVTVTTSKKQERMFLTPEEVRDRFEQEDDSVEDAPKHKRYGASPEHVQGETTKGITLGALPPSMWSYLD